MVFSTPIFLFYFLVFTLLVYYQVPRGLRNVVLLCSSLFFYYWGERIYVVIMLLSTVIDFTHGMLVERWRDNDRKARMAVASSVFFNLLILVTFKYYDFLAGSLNAVTGWNIPLLGVPMPIGISFYTFRSAAYVIDVYRGKAQAQRNIARYALFVSFFPAVVQGPICRYNDLMPALTEPHSLTWEDSTAGLVRVAWGYFKKVAVAEFRIRI